MKQCTKCKEKKALDQFNKNASSKDRLASRCRQCEKEIKSNKKDIYSDLYKFI